MAILSRRKRVLDETLPDGRSVYEAVRSLARNPEDDPGSSPDRMSGVQSPIAPRLSLVPDQPQPEVLSRPAMPSQTLDTPAVPDLSATDYYQQNHTIRPKIDPAIRDPQAQLSRYEQDVRNYQPQKESLGKALLRVGKGFVMGGLPGAGLTALDEAIDPRQHDRAWQQRELAGADRGLATIGARRREGMQEDLMRSQIEENQAQAIRAQREPLSRDPGFTLGAGQARYDAKGNLITTRPAAEKQASTKPPVKQMDENGNEYLADAETGEPLLDSKGNVRYTARAKAEKPEKLGADNKTRAAWNYKKQKEAEATALDLRQQANAIVAAQGYDLDKGQAAQKEDLLRRAAAAESDARKYRDEGDKAATEPTTPTRGNAATPSSHGFSVRGWLATHKGKTKKDAIADHDANYPDYKIVP